MHYLLKPETFFSLKKVALVPKRHVADKTNVTKAFMDLPQPPDKIQGVTLKDERAIIETIKCTEVTTPLSVLCVDRWKWENDEREDHDR